MHEAGADFGRSVLQNRQGQHTEVAWLRFRRFSSAGAILLTCASTVLKPKWGGHFRKLCCMRQVATVEAEAHDAELLSRGC